MRALPAFVRTLLAFALCACAYSQPTTVAISKEPANQAVTTFTYLDASSNPQYICKALSSQPTYVWAVTATASTQGSLTSIVVSSNTGTVTVGAHGFDNPRSVGSVVWVSGSTTSALNGAYIIQSVTSGTVFTITTSGVSDGTYNNAALTLSSNAPQTTLARWSVERFTYSSSVATADQWASNIATGQGGSTAKSYICANRASLAYQ